MVILITGITSGFGKAMAERLTGVPRKLPKGSREVAKVIYRDGTQIDSIWCVK